MAVGTFSSLELRADDGCVTCNNITNGGEICCNQTGNAPFDPATIYNTALPTGGSGAIEYLWLYKRASTGWNWIEIINNQDCYDPGSLCETTIYRRCSRRANCSNYPGESNDITITVNGSCTCNAQIDALVIHNLVTGSPFVTLQNGYTYSEAALPANWNIEALVSGSSAQSVKFTFTGDYSSNNTENVVPYRSPTDDVGLNLNPGTYTLNAKVYSQDNSGGNMCSQVTLTFTITGCDNITDGGDICCNQTGCAPYDPAELASSSPPSGGSGGMEIVWLYKNASTGWNYQTIADANGLTYNPGEISETTTYRRCARRAGCTEYIGESNEITITVNNCNPCASNLLNEQFDYSNGTTSSPNFTVSYSAPSDGAAHTFAVVDGAFKAVNTDNEGVWTSSVFNIAGLTNVNLSALIWETGDHENEDYIKVYYKLDGGPLTLFSINGNKSNDFGSAVAAQIGLTGSTIQVIIKVKNSSGSEVHYFDNVTITADTTCEPLEICLLTGYESENGRIFWIPNFGTDFKSSPSDPLTLAKYAGGLAHIYGTVQRISNADHKFVVSLWFNNESDYASWVAQGNQAHTPNLGDESTWIYYDFDTSQANTLIGAGSLAGQILLLTNQMDVYGLQLGNGANSLNSNTNGLSTWFNYTGTTSGNGDINGSYSCDPTCELDVNAGPNQDLSCIPGSELEITAEVSGQQICETPSITDCNHTLATFGGYLADSNASTICGDNAGTKLWTAGNQGTSFVTLDMGIELPAGTQICVNMKLEHCITGGTNYSNVKIEAATSVAGTYSTLINSVTFTHTNYQEYCYTLSAPARYIKVSDNGNCSFRVDYVEYTVPGTSGGDLSYAWSGPGIVGANNNSTVVVDEAGTYIVLVTDCGGCTSSDTVLVTGVTCGPITFQNVPTNIVGLCEGVYPPALVTASNNCNNSISVSIQTATSGSDCNYVITHTYTAVDACGTTAIASYTITVLDTGAPVFANDPSNLTIGCDESIPAAQDLIATDNCDDQLTYTYTEEVIGLDGPSQECNILKANDHILWVSNPIKNALGLSNNNFVSDGANEMTLFNDGSMKITGTVKSAQTANKKFQYEVWYHLKRTFEEWTSIPNPNTASGFREEKLDAGTTVTINNEYLDWSYFELDTSKPHTLIGQGALAGVVLNVLHFPTDYRFGGQLGDKASLQSLGYGFSAWIQISGNVNGTYVSDQGDFNLKLDGCEEIPPVVDCASQYEIVRTWTATDDCGNSAAVSQTLFVGGDDEAPVFANQTSVFDLDCTESAPVVEPVVADNCDDDLTLTYIETTDCEFVESDCNFKTYTQGGWGAPANGNNPGVYRDANFAAAFPNGLIIGCASGNTLTLTTALAVKNFLPSGSTPSALPSDLLNPGNSYNNVLAGQLTALTLSLGFDAYDANFAPSPDFLGNGIVGSGTFAGMTVSQLVQIANDVIGGCSNAYSFSSLNAALTAINENFDGGSNGGFVICETSDPTCSCTVTHTWTATDNCGNSSIFVQTYVIGDNEGPIPSADPLDASVECDDQIPSVPVITWTDACGEVIESWYCEEIVQIDECDYQIVRMWHANDGCNLAYVEQIITVTDNTAPVLVGIPNDMTGLCDDVFVPAVVTATDNCDENVEVVVTTSTNGSGCDYTITYTYTATDDCGNSVSDSYTISVLDNTDPVISGVPANITVECDAVPGIPTSVYATDNCDDQVIPVYTEEIIPGEPAMTGGPACGYTIIRRWTATDDCDNTVVATQTVTVVDTTAPILIGVPANATVECDNIPMPSVVTAVDNCWNGVIHVALQENVVPIDECSYQIIRTWIAEDNCWNYVSESQVLTVVDTTDPVLYGVPANATIECDELISDAIVFATDNCDEDVMISLTAYTLESDCGHIFIRTWTATDNCGNSVSQTQTITVVDTTAPVFDGQDSELTLECNIQPTVIAPTATDNCDEELTINFDTQTIPGDCENEWTTVYIWTAIDDCGNSAIRTMTFHFVDTTPPVLVGVPNDMNGLCDQDIIAAIVTATDNCDNDVVVTVSSSTIGEGCDYAIVFTYTAIDNCGNSVSDSYTVTVLDLTPPVIYGVPANITVECDAVPGVATSVYATDNCDDLVIPVYSEEIVAGNPTNGVMCGYIIYRRWTATDDCGNATVVTQTVTVVDTTAPILIGVPVNTTVECTLIPTAAVVTATDNCYEPINVLFEEVLLDFSGCGYQLIRTWSAVDNCGNVVSQTQTILVLDYTAPVPTYVPADVTVECDEELPTDVPTFVDACDDDFEVTFISAIAFDDCYTIISQSWTATDDCENSITVSRSINVVDTTAPVFSGEDFDLTLECNVQPTVVEPTATDNCDEDLTIDFSTSSIPGDCENEWTTIYTWTATDECGNVGVRIYTFHFVDTTPPVLVMPTNTFVNETCEEGFLDILLNFNAGVYTPAEVQEVLADLQAYFVLNGLIPLGATDNCDENPTWSEIDIIVETAGLDCPVVGRITCVFQAQDDCGNLSQTASTYIYVIDEDAPVITGVPADLTVECDNVPGVPTSVIATDGCYGLVPTVYTEEIIPGEPAMTGGPACGYTIIRRWTATDDCGNTAIATQVVTVVDTTAPVLIGVPANATVECDNIPAPSIVTAVDNCWTAEIHVALEENIVPIDECSYQIIRTWIAEDNCWNYVSESQVLTVVDTTDPILYGVPANATIECDQVISDAVVFATDNCDDDVLISLTAYTEASDCGYLFVRTWVATDNCGNTSAQTQIITVVDTTDPMATYIPQDVTVECDEALPTDAPIFTDNCDEELTYTAASSTGFDDCEHYIYQSWTATDDCGNSTTVNRTITIVDTTDPYATYVPQDVTIECDEALPTDAPTFADNCDQELSLSAISATGFDNCIEYIYQTWTAVDDCGNSVSVSRTITIVDTTAPVLVNVPAGVTVECTDIPAAPIVYALDNCDGQIVATLVEEIIPQNCGYLIIRSWSAHDACLNTGTGSQVIVVTDYTDPIAVFVPQNVTVECNTILPIDAPIFTDNCDEDLSIHYSVSEGVDNCYGLITQTWIATDNCGNSTTVVRVINVVDTTNPVLYGVPANATIECDQVISDAVVFATDNCDDDVLISLTAYTEASDCGYLFVRTWVATDNCGNTSAQTQIITVVDTTDPMATYIPQDVTVECDEALPTDAPIFTDNCDEELTYTAASSTGFDDCEHYIYQSWTATDDCGNSTTVNRTITIVDTTDPYATYVPQDVTIECDEALPTDAPTFADNCDQELSLSAISATGFDNCIEYIYQTWTAVDDCGNSVSVSRTITIVDTTAPVLVNVPAGVTVECTDIPAAPIVYALDNCDGQIVATLVEEIIPQNCGYLIIRSWSAHDACLNTGTGSQVIVVTDYTDPIAVFVPQNVTVECNTILPIDAPIFTDNCDEDLSIHYSVSEGVDNCYGLITQTWIATDNCGNSTTVVRVINVVDTTNPVLYGVPANATIECDQVISDAVVFATDNCDDDVLISLTAYTEASDCGYLFVRTWVATDNCGNTSAQTQIITVVDTTDPIIVTEPADAAYLCEEEIPYQVPTFTDNCDDELTVVYNEVITGDCPYTHTRTWTATDDCGNSIVATQIITVTDNVAPIFAPIPAFIMVSCDEIDEYIVVAYDNCDMEVEVTVLNETIFSGGCLFYAYRTWLATDNCGNTATIQQLIQIVDQVAPVLHNVPEDLELSCSEEIPAPSADVFATDNCDSDVTIIFTETQSDDVCPFVITRTWTAIDDCGNVTEVVQTIIVGEIEGPGPGIVGCAGDFNNDGQIDIMDLLMLNGEVGCNNGCTCDMNEDDSINIGDFLMFIPKFGTSCE